MDVDELRKVITADLGGNTQDITVDYGRIGTGCSEVRYLRLINSSAEPTVFQLHRDYLSHPLGDVFSMTFESGAIGAGRSAQITMRYRPRHPYVKDTDFFELVYSSGSIRLRLEGVSCAPALVASRALLEFGSVAARAAENRSFLLHNAGQSPAAFCCPISSAAFSVEPIGGEVLPGQRVRVAVSCWVDRPRPLRRQLPLLVHAGQPPGRQTLQLLAGGALCTELPPPPPPPENIFQLCPTLRTPDRLAVLDAGRIDFGRACAVEGETRVLHMTNISSQELHVEWLSDRRDVLAVRPPSARLCVRQTAMFEVLFLPDIPDMLYLGHVEALLWPVELPNSALIGPAGSTLALPAFGHTFADGGETWVPRVQLTPSPLVLPPCPLSGRVRTTVTLRNLDAEKPLVYDLDSAPDSLRVWPEAGMIAPKGLHVLAVNYTASAVEIPRGRLQLRWRLNLHENHVLPLTVLASQEAPSVSWTPAELRPPPACRWMKVSQRTQVRNLTRCRLRLTACPCDAALATDRPELTLAPNDTCDVEWSCLAEQSGRHEFIIPHRLQLLDPTDNPLGAERVQNLRLQLTVVPELLRCEPDRVELGHGLPGVSERQEVNLVNESDAEVRLLLHLLPRPLVAESAGAAAILLKTGTCTPLESSVCRLTVPANTSVPVTLQLTADRPGKYHRHLTYQLLPEPGGGRPIAPPCGLAEVTLTAHHPHVHLADLEAVSGDKFEDKSLLWRLLAVDRVNAALAVPDSPSSPLLLVFPPRPLSAPPLRLTLLLENRGQVPAGWRWQLPPDAGWLALAPASGELAPAERQPVHLTIGPLSAPGLASVQLGLVVHGGCALPLTAVASAVPMGAGRVYTPSEPPWPDLLPADPCPPPAATSHRVSLHPVRVGSRAPPLQFIPLFNAGLRPVQYHVHTDALLALAAENFGVSVLACLDREGIVPAGGCTRIRLLFQPLEVREYSALLPVCVSEPCGGTPLFLIGQGTALNEDDPTLPLMPARQLATIPGQEVLLSHRYVHFGTLSTHTAASRIVYLTNASVDVVRFAWTRRLSVADVCAVYGAESGSSGEDSACDGVHSTAGPSVQPEPAEGILRPKEVLPVRLTLSAGHQPQIYEQTLHVAFRNLTRERLFALNRAAWETTSRRREAEFTITASRPDGQTRPASPPPHEPAVVYMTVSLAALVLHLDDTWLGASLQKRQRVFVPLMAAPVTVCSSSSPSSFVPTSRLSPTASAAEMCGLKRQLSNLLWQLLRDYELQNALKRLRKDAVPVFSQLQPRPETGRQFRRPRIGEEPLLLERTIHSALFNIAREAGLGEFQLAQSIDDILRETELMTEARSEKL